MEYSGVLWTAPLYMHQLHTVDRSKILHYGISGALNCHHTSKKQ
uniref:Uncharacterized protein n=1 Tax=Setaria viridis TaxID=4556 RepID=A0A4U6UNC7_SETVI|nr:hypothetical protein SEVIR_5G392150v2 [Setaria viridis]